MTSQIVRLCFVSLVMSLMAAGCDSGVSIPRKAKSIASAGASGAAAAGGPAPEKNCGARDEPVAPGVVAQERCNAWDDDCDGLIDEGFDRDGDGHSTCKEIDNGDDCDDDNPAIHPGHAELCDDLDNDCNKQWDEGCPTPHCGIGRVCPDGLECVETGGPCIEPKPCPEVRAIMKTCAPPEEDAFAASPCDPAQCVGWQGGTCWGECSCAADGVYRWRANCTE
jgi:hypothetical protein